jgi:BirA family transcriptional regulator, biotin operon repressor / biotin---[acetyl-CoA-carboxylase] ligase
MRGELDTRGLPGRGRPLPAQVHAQLSSGGFHSGADLARRLGVSRSAIWKAVVSLRGLGLVVNAVRNRGYRLPAPCEPLDPRQIRAGLHGAVRERVRHAEVAWSLASTNALLLARTDLAPGAADVLLAEYQSAGRGRRGRAWLAPLGGAICLSLSWSFPAVPRDLAALGLAVGVCARRALGRRAREPIVLKWPNDLTIGDRKLGGILIELRAESEGPAYVVIGLGVNVALGPQVRKAVEATGTQPTDLETAGADPLARNALVADLVSEIVEGLVRFEREGLRPFIEEWKAADALRGRPVSVHSGEATTRGIARGIDSTGALLLETPQGLKRFLSGEVSVRPRG